MFFNDRSIQRINQVRKTRLSAYFFIFRSRDEWIKVTRSHQQIKRQCQQGVIYLFFFWGKVKAHGVNFWSRWYLAVEASWSFLVFPQEWMKRNSWQLGFGCHQLRSSWCYNTGGFWGLCKPRLIVFVDVGGKQKLNSPPPPTWGWMVSSIVLRWRDRDVLETTKNLLDAI